jgi:myo-inositol 2-dehydrogenase / D-chiro-inositol 1-dehydrogenase
MPREDRSDTTTSPTRRDIIKTTAATSATAMFAALGTNFAHAQGTDIIKVGVIGCGGRGNGAAGNCVEGAALAGAKAEIYAVGDVFEGQTKNLKDKHKVDNDKVFAGLEAYGEVINAGVNLVILATPPGFRPLHFKTAVEAGKHVFFEKPVAVDPVGVRTVMEYSKIAEEKKLAIVTGTQRRHEINYIDTIGKIHDGLIGDVLHMSVYWNGAGIWSRPRKPGMSDVEYQINNWYHYVWLCGDQICEQHIHNIDVANWVLKAHPISAYGMGGRQVRRDPGQIWDHFAIEYEYPSGARVLSMCRHWPQSDDAVGEVVIGSKGTADPGAWIQVNGEERRRNAPKDPSGKNGYVLEHRDLVRSMLAGKPLNEGQQVAESTLTAIMGRMSAYTGRRIYWDKEAAKAARKGNAPTAMESTLDTFPKNLDLKGTLPEPPVPMPDVEEPV